MLPIVSVADFVLGDLPTNRHTVDVFSRVKRCVHLLHPLYPDPSVDRKQLGRLQGWKQVGSSKLRYVATYQ